MIIKQTYKPDRDILLSWDELKVGDVVYHIFTANVLMKTSKNSYVSLYDKKYHTRSKLLQGSHSKVYQQFNAEFIFSDEPIAKPCENCDLYFKAMTKQEEKNNDRK